jgi:hypothetical protein
MAAPFASTCPHCGAAKERPHRTGCRGTTPGSLDRCSVCKVELFGAALSLSGYEFAKSEEARHQALRRRNRRGLVLLVLALIAAAAAAAVHLGHLKAPW